MKGVLGAVLLTLGAAAGPALADAPLVTPLADTDVRYRIAGPGGTMLGQRMRWRSEGWLQRIDPEGSASFMVTDYRAGRLSVVDTAHRVVSTMDVPLASFAPPGVPAPGQWARAGVDHVAGLECTEWNGRDSDGRTTQFCYTADGVLLQAARDGVTMLRAVAVAHDPQDSGIFAVPSGFRAVKAQERR
ncbi:hypothetical protein [Acidomonas methanolica]|uniref:hypothetical protein n=1 Tax=Acidomonas methanolica TaxID=437 RepID=UPI00211A7DE9|nr:hypothetical protein [Acidomonas methanolica]MCQ9156147.1 hypothetical protein [Acidomonas methanolica]